MKVIGRFVKAPYQGYVRRKSKVGFLPKKYNYIEPLKRRTSSVYKEK